MKFLTATSLLLALSGVSGQELRVFGGGPPVEEAAPETCLGGTGAETGTFCYPVANYAWTDFWGPEPGREILGEMCIKMTSAGTITVDYRSTDPLGEAGLFGANFWWGTDMSTAPLDGNGMPIYEDFSYVLSEDEVEGDMDRVFTMDFDSTKACEGKSEYTLKFAFNTKLATVCEPDDIGAVPGKKYVFDTDRPSWALAAEDVALLGLRRYDAETREQQREFPTVDLTIACDCVDGKPRPAPPRDDETTTTSPSGTRGDPHFKTHGGERYDFHGGCDLVLVDNPDFHDGLGMLAHIRTKIETWWSYVESAAVKIGNDTVEVSGNSKTEWLFLNGKVLETPETGKWQKVFVAGLAMRYRHDGKNGEAHIYFGDNKSEKLELRTFNEFVKVDVGVGHHEGVDHYVNSLGLLGRFPDGERVGRDGETVIEDVNDFGQEWQVRTDEPKLFRNYDAPWVVPAGQKCAMPDESASKKALRQRRLANGMDMDVAEKACGHLTDAADFKACVYDVIATQDTNMAAVW